MTNKVNNMIHSKELLNSILRQDFHSFIIKVFNTINPGTEYYPSKHIRIITDYLNAVQSGEINRLIYTAKEFKIYLCECCLACLSTWG
ncbi:hypothetical protein RAS_07800 [Rickettsia asiatica]|uniref:Uncharacterized protein n=1 Tax=Rickettsia asiatica TaxID=238800 RepID=A0A510GIX8_9RICK|nr:hypothetical protein [Rickettsia asiatica]BBJ31671.1 hypothetical protein RAS_07800 [Rickettsia asiatica]